jgi:hypothetical protein
MCSYKGALWSQFVNDTDVVATPIYQLDKSCWVLKLDSAHPTSFELQFDGEIHYVGVIEVMNNGNLISVSEANWKFRHKTDRLEQWCQVQHSETLSINMNYYFSDDALVIEYLARNSVPTRLDIRHEIQHLPRPIDKEALPKPHFPWQHRRDGLPSDFLSKTEKTDFFREAFSAKQWIILDKL